MISFGPKMGPGAIFHSPIDFGPPSIKAGVVVLILSLKLPEGEFVSHGRFSYGRIVLLFLLVVKG